MKYLNTCYLILLLGCLLLSCEENPVPEPEPEIKLTSSELQVLESLNAEVSPLITAPLNIPDADLLVLDRLGDKKMIGLGEATHGTREFFQMKHRIFKYLVEKHGFKAFLFEMDLAEALIFDNWIQGNNPGNLKDLMRNKMLFWTWRTEEVEALFRWMKSYNENKPEDQRIHLYGVDNQYVDYNLDALLARLESLDPVLADSVRTFNPKLKRIWELYASKVQSQADQIDEGIRQTQALLSREKDYLIRTGSAQEFLWMERLARHMEQVANYLYEYHFLSDFRLRDQYMAENSLWYEQLLGDDAKVVLWAHNGHVAKNQFFGDAPSQGGHLDKALGNDYQVVGFGFSKGSFTAYGGGNLGTKQTKDEPRRDSYNFIFNRAEASNFILDMKQLQAPSLKDWFLSRKRFLSFGSIFEGAASQYYLTTPLLEYYDVLVYFDETQNSILL